MRVDFVKDISDLTLSIICDAAFGFMFQNKKEKAYLMPFFADIAEEMNQKIIDPTDWWPVLIISPSHTFLLFFICYYFRK